MTTSVPRWRYPIPRPGTVGAPKAAFHEIVSGSVHVFLRDGEAPPSRAC